MAVTFVDAATTSENNNTSHAINLPTHIGGDWVGVLLAQSNESGVTWTAPTDWTEEVDENDDTPGYGFYLAWRIAPKGGLGSSVTFTPSQEVGVRAAAVSYRGVRPTTPIEVISSASINAAEATPESPTITTLADDAMVPRLLSMDGTEFLTVPSGTTERVNVGGNQPNNGSKVGWADDVQATAGSAGAAEWTIDGSEESTTLSLALAEGSSSTVTLEPWALWTVTQMRTDIAPGASGWDWLTEEDSMEEIIAAAQEIVGVPDELRLGVRNVIVYHFLIEVTAEAGEGLRDVESWLSAGLVNSTLISVEDILLNHPEVQSL